MLTVTLHFCQVAMDCFNFVIAAWQIVQRQNGVSDIETGEVTGIFLFPSLSTVERWKHYFAILELIISFRQTGVLIT